MSANNYAYPDAHINVNVGIQMPTLVNMSIPVVKIGNPYGVNAYFHISSYGHCDAHMNVKISICTISPCKKWSHEVHLSIFIMFES